MQKKSVDSYQSARLAATAPRPNAIATTISAIAIAVAPRLTFCLGDEHRRRFHERARETVAHRTDAPSREVLSVRNASAPRAGHPQRRRGARARRPRRL